MERKKTNSNSSATRTKRVKGGVRAGKAKGADVANISDALNTKGRSGMKGSGSALGRVSTDTGKQMFDDPRSGHERRKEVIPYMIPLEGCRRKRNRRSWRSRVNSDKWWVMRGYLRND